MNGPRSKPGPRLDIRGLCALCGKPMLAGHATCETQARFMGRPQHTFCTIATLPHLGQRKPAMGYLDVSSSDAIGAPLARAVVVSTVTRSARRPCTPCSSSSSSSSTPRVR